MRPTVSPDLDFWNNIVCSADSISYERLVSEMTYYVSSGTLNSTNSTHMKLAKLKYPDCSTVL